jgi:hypothetical protein
MGLIAPMNNMGDEKEKRKHCDFRSLIYDL